MSLKEKLYDEILIKIINGDFDKEELLVESKLTEQFGTSRSPIREALIELCKDNVLKNIPRAGYQIVTVSNKEIREACEVRILLESRAAELACENATEKEIEELETIHSETLQLSKKEPTEYHRLMQLKFDFHLRIANMSRNVVLYRMINEISKILWRATAQRVIEEHYQSDFTGHAKYHGKIIDALRNRDKTRVVELITLDYEALEEVLKNY